MNQGVHGVVETESGKLSGELRGEHWAFRGIPYAKPPVGSLRFRAPQRAEPWTGVRDASKFGPSSLQGAVFAPGVAADGPLSEDCLYLNVFTPAADDAARPVMFFIHGGAFTVGSASSALYDGGKLAAQHDVVVVTINYRVGALGYLALGEAGARWDAVDNRGTLDQLAALHWVRTNIARFGGDPDNVTLFGESAGATSVCLLLTMPSARGLFARAISQSMAMGLELPTMERAGPITAAYLRALDLAPGESESLQDLPAEALMRAQAQVESDWSSWPHFNPVAAPLFGGQPRASLEGRLGSAVPLLLGANRDEWNLFALSNVADWAKPLADDELLAQLSRKLPPGKREHAPRLIESYRSARRQRGLPHQNRALLRALEGDLRFRMPGLRFVELYQTQAETHVYSFSYASPALRGELGACHALELPFVFGSYDAPGQDRFAGSGDDVVSLSRTMMSAWASFARGAPSWPRYTLGERATMEFDVQSKLVNDWFGEERQAWDGVL
jgi:para-nitrobenzyl esterase